MQHAGSQRQLCYEEQTSAQRPTDWPAQRQQAKQSSVWAQSWQTPLTWITGGLEVKAGTASRLNNGSSSSFLVFTVISFTRFNEYTI
jgi:hypothetical protein